MVPHSADRKVVNSVGATAATWAAVLVAALVAHWAENSVLSTQD